VISESKEKKLVLAPVGDQREKIKTEDV